MAISLSKGGNISLSKMEPTLNSVRVGLGWDARSTDGAPFDLDASVMVCGADGRVLSNEHFIFYNQLQTPDGAVRHSGDVRDGEIVGDDEQVFVNLAGMAADVDKLAFVATIHEADSRGQNFGQVRNAFIRVVNESSKEEMARYDLTEDASMETAMVFGELYRNGAEWKFRAVGQGYASGLEGIARDFGVAL
ncbi:TerD family protein [Nocardioides speluncae]|uniref:TerD family protein n=1 Tax=Nocardioides speluncae TaxID=2670337 RepID=UPI000D691BE0|nr:TerD family protein [Nocardioides speluncae]